MQNVFFHLREQEKMIHQTVKRRHNHAGRVFHQMTKHRDSLARQKVSVNVRAVKQQILCGIQPHIIPETAEIVVDLLCSRILIRHHKFPRHIKSCLLHQMYLLGIHASTDLNGTFSPLDLSIQLFELRQFRQRTCKYLTHLLFTSTYLFNVNLKNPF